MKVKRLNETLIDIAGTGFPLCRCHKGASINLLSQVNGASFTRARVRGVKHMNLLSPHPRLGEGGFIHQGEGITNFIEVPYTNCAQNPCRPAFSPTCRAKGLLAYGPDRGPC